MGLGSTKAVPSSFVRQRVGTQFMVALWELISQTVSQFVGYCLLLLSNLLLQAASRGTMALVTKCETTSLSNHQLCPNRTSNFMTCLTHIFQIAVTFGKRLSRTRKCGLNQILKEWYFDGSICACHKAVVVAQQRINELNEQE